MQNLDDGLKARRRQASMPGPSGSEEPEPAAPGRVSGPAKREEIDVIRLGVSGRPATGRLTRKPLAFSLRAGLVRASRLRSVGDLRLSIFQLSSS